ncbi:phospholipase [Amycolatopsis thermalba]|uniref:Phospholipase n=1 Tax=Amycolatopsis thermalba TaxID=944492 RepID=A0ABY4NVI1_9PSEU|nr:MULTISPECIES: phospholipase [Amycolatopsis]UQS24081.1 phospholipase [Amycolatopsis thermalba]
MRVAARRLLSTAALATALVAGTGTAQAADIGAVTDKYLFGTSLSRFEEIRADRPYAAKLDWSSDTCSWSPDKPLGFDFSPACHRHDFGYRNYKRQDRFTSANRKKIDDNFYADLKVICHGDWRCNGTAWTYYQAVRKFGGS